MEKNNGIKIVITALIVIICILVVCLICGLIYMFAFTDTFKSNKQIFFKYIGKDVKNICSFAYDENIENYGKKKLESPLESSGNLKIESNGYDDEKSNSATLAFKNTTDLKNHYDEKILKLNYSQDQSIKIGYINNEDYALICIPEVTKKYVGIDKNNLDELYNNLELSDSQKESIKEILEDYNKYLQNGFNFEKFEFKEDYEKAIVDNISNDDITKEENGDGNLYCLTLNRNQILKIFNDELTVVEDDESLFQYLQENFGMTEDQKNNIKNKISEVKSDIEKKLEEEDEEGLITISLQVNNDKTNNIEIDFLNNLNISLSCKEDSIDVKAKINGITDLLLTDDYISEDDDEDLDYNIEDVNDLLLDTESIDEIEDVNTIFADTESLSDSEDISSDLDEDLTMEDIEDMNLTDDELLESYEWDINITKSKNDDNISYNVQWTSSDGIEKNNINIEYTGISSENVHEKIQLNYTTDDIENNISYENNVEFKSEIEKEEIENSNIVTLNDKTKDQIYNFLDKYVEKLENIHLKKVEDAGMETDVITDNVENLIEIPLLLWWYVNEENDTEENNSDELYGFEYSNTIDGNYIDENAVNN